MLLREGVEVDAEALAALCARYGVVELALFGSSVRDDFRPDSDVDVLVTFADDAPGGLFHLIRLQDELSTLLGRPVDLGQKHTLKPQIRDDVLAEARVIYDAA